MGYITRHRVHLQVTATGGAAQVFYSSATLSGLLHAVAYRPGPATAPATGAAAIATGAHLALAAEIGGFGFLGVTATGMPGNTWFPRMPAQSSAGVALGYSSGAAPPMVPTYMPLSQERVSVTVTSGGVASGTAGLLGTVYLYIDGV